MRKILISNIQELMAPAADPMKHKFRTTAELTEWWAKLEAGTRKIGKR